MNHSVKQGLFPGFSILTGLVGFALQCWLFSMTDKRGLLPQNHIAEILCFGLLALTVTVCWLVSRTVSRNSVYRQLFPASTFAAIGSVAGAAGIGYAAFSLDYNGPMHFLLPVLGVICVILLLRVAQCRDRGQKPNFLLHGVVCVFFMLRILINCRQWGTEPQLQLYIFPLLASIFTLLTCYFRAELDFNGTDCRKYLIFGQASVFCCCLCMAGEDWLFYLLTGFWLAADCCALPAPEAE